MTRRDWPILRSQASLAFALSVSFLLWSCRVESSRQAPQSSPADDQAAADTTSASDSAPDATSAAPAFLAEQVLIGDVNWYVDYDAAVAVARVVNKPLWVHFGENPG